MRISSQRRALRTLILAALGALVLAACTRSATTETLPDTTGGDGGGEAAIESVVDQEATMNALLEQGKMTQTAEAADAAAEGVGGGGETPVPDETQSATEATTEPGAAAEATETPAAPTAAPTGVATTYTVQAGDWVYQIARNFGVDPQALIAANPGIEANSIQPGQVLNIPAPGEPVPGSAETGQTTYVVQPGDNLFRIALNYGMAYDVLAAANGLAAPYTVFPGQVLVIPAS